MITSPLLFKKIDKREPFYEYIDSNDDTVTDTSDIVIHARQSSLYKPGIYRYNGTHKMHLILKICYRDC